LVWHIDPSLAGTISENGNSQNADRFRKAVDLEEADGRDELDNETNRGDSGDPFPGSTGNQVFADYTYPNSQPYSGAQCTAAIRDLALTGETVTGTLIPSERWVIWGDADGSRSVLGWEDTPVILWYALGYRDAGEQRYIDQADVDADGDIDVRDAFMVLSHASGLSVPGERLGSTEIRDCGVITGAMTAGGSGVAPLQGAVHAPAQRGLREAESRRNR
jgi:hypothetical protein